jgi:chorismate mutase/prephenate dehydratase
MWLYLQAEKNMSTGRNDMIQDDQKTTSLNLEQLRSDIDSVDQQIQDLLNRRARLAEAVAKAKFATEANPVFYRPEREAQVLRKVMERNEGPLSDATMARLFREIMSACLALEAPQSIAFLGPEGTFTQAAALKHFGQDAIVRPIATIDEVFREVEAGSAHYGVVPVENSSEGVVNHTLDCFKSSSLNVIGEVELRIHHQFLCLKIPVKTALNRFMHTNKLWLSAVNGSTSIIQVLNVLL